MVRTRGWQPCNPCNGYQHAHPACFEGKRQLYTHTHTHFRAHKYARSPALTLTLSGTQTHIHWHMTSSAPTTTLTLSGTQTHIHWHMTSSAPPTILALSGTQTHIHWHMISSAPPTTLTLSGTQTHIHWHMISSAPPTTSPSQTHKHASRTLAPQACTHMNAHMKRTCEPPLLVTDRPEAPTTDDSAWLIPVGARLTGAWAPATPNTPSSSAEPPPARHPDAGSLRSCPEPDSRSCASWNMPEGARVGLGRERVGLKRTEKLPTCGGSGAGRGSSGARHAAPAYALMCAVASQDVGSTAC